MVTKAKNSPSQWPVWGQEARIFVDFAKLLLFVITVKLMIKM
jgi:hypothetical protein